MKKKIIITIILLLMAAAVFFVIAKNKGLFDKKDEQLAIYMEKVNEDNAVFFYYGNMDPDKSITVDYKKINKFTDETLEDTDNKYAFHEIIIFDLDGKMDLSDEELLLIKKYCEEKYYDLIYYGTENIKRFIDCEYFSYVQDNQNCFVYSGSYWMNRTGIEKWIEPYAMDVIGNLYTNDRNLMWKDAIISVSDLIDEALRIND